MIIDYLLIGILSLVFLGLLLFIMGTIILSLKIEKEIANEALQNSLKQNKMKFYKWNALKKYDKFKSENGEGYFKNKDDLELFLLGNNLELVWSREEILHQLGNNNILWNRENLE